MTPPPDMARTRALVGVSAPSRHGEFGPAGRAAVAGLCSVRAVPVLPARSTGTTVGAAGPGFQFKLRRFATGPGCAAPSRAARC